MWTHTNYNWYGSYLAFVTPEKFVVTVGVTRSRTFVTSLVAVRSDRMTEEDDRNLSRASWERVKLDALAWFEGEDDVPVDLDEPKPCCVRQMIGTVFRPSE